MVSPTKQALYVMQNEFGLFKIGRSDFVERRRKALQSELGCCIEVVAEFPGCGDLEEPAHIAMGEYRLIGEWFDGCDEARTALLNHLGNVDIDWKFALNEEDAAAWLDEFAASRDRNHLWRQIYRVVSSIRDAKTPHRRLDLDIFRVVWLEKGRIPEVSHITLDGKVSWIFHDAETCITTEVPKYTSDLAAAQTLLDEQNRPAKFAGTAIECCVAGLTALLRRLPRT